MFKVGDKVTIAWDRLKEASTEIEFKHYKKLLTAELKRGGGTLEVLNTSVKNVAGVAGWSGSALLGLIYVPDYVLNRVNPVSGMANEEAARELILYIENDADLYRQQFIPIVYNLQRKIKKGTFDLEKSIKMWDRLADLGAKKYIKEHGSPGDKWNMVFSKGTRDSVAKELSENFIAEVQAGNFLD
jgi:hypothetical protein